MGSPLRATSLTGYAQLVRELGGDPVAYLSRFHIPVGVEREPDTFIPLRDYASLLEVTAEELQCPDFGLRLTRFQGVDLLGPIAVIARNSETVLTALEATARFIYIHTPAVKMTIECTDTHLRGTHELTEPVAPYPLQTYEAMAVIGVRFYRFFAGPDAPVTVSLLHAQLSPDRVYRDAFGCPVRFGQSWYGYESPVAVAASRICDADPETLRIVIKYLEATYLPQTAPLSERVAEQARQLLPTGLCSVDAIADQLAMHPRTLQRRLATEGLRCQDVIDRERRTQAERYLAVPGLHLSQIAGLLGYTEQSAFNRSCRRWFAMTPRQFRASGAVKVAIDFR